MDSSVGPLTRARKHSHWATLSLDGVMAALDDMDGQVPEGHRARILVAQDLVADVRAWVNARWKQAVRT